VQNINLLIVKTPTFEISKEFTLDKFEKRTEGKDSAIMSGIFTTIVDNAVHYVERKDRRYIRKELL